MLHQAVYRTEHIVRRTGPERAEIPGSRKKRKYQREIAEDYQQIKRYQLSEASRQSHKKVQEIKGALFLFFYTLAVFTCAVKHIEQIEFFLSQFFILPLQREFVLVIDLKYAVVQ